MNLNEFAIEIGTLIKDAKQDFQESLSRLEDRVEQQKQTIDTLEKELDNARQDYNKLYEATQAPVSVSNDLDVLPAIDEDKTYERGTYALHNGGLFRSYQQSQGDHNFECVLNGIHHIESEIDGKTLRITIVDSKGDKFTTEDTIPYQLYQGIWDEQLEYTAGDTVTRAGSVWIAIADVKGEAPNKSDKWVLAVKRGRDAK